MPMEHTEKSALVFDGLVEPQFAPVREPFVANFEQNLELGAAVAVYHRGKLVVDLAGGLFARGSEIKYSRETLQPIFSATKGITALAANMLSDRGQLDLEAPVVDYWPEFAQAGSSGSRFAVYSTTNQGCWGWMRRFPLSSCSTGM